MRKETPKKPKKRVPSLATLDRLSSQSAYMRGSISTAAGHMPARFKRHFIAAFKATGCMDIYGGEPWRYMQVIAQVLGELRSGKLKTATIARQLYVKMTDLRDWARGELVRRR